jgi:hypothetical protein
MSWQDCVLDSDYEILSEFPFDIRKKSTGRYLAEGMKKGYPAVALNGRSIEKHIIIMKQFKPHEETGEKLEVDHRNRNKTDYHLSNLRWVSHSQNMRNRSGYLNKMYEYVDELPDDAIIVNEYGKHEFEDLYFHEDAFYFFNGIQFRKLHIAELKNGSLQIKAFDINGTRCGICYAKFKREYDLI